MGEPGPWVDACFLGRLVILARDQGRALDARALGTRHGLRGEAVPLETVQAVAWDAGFLARHRRLTWGELPSVAACLPGLLVFRDHSTAILDGLVPAAGTVPPTALLVREDGPGDATPSPPLALNRDDLAPLWDGDLVLLAPRPPAA
ncbi:cysteine peptidase family C39 domain-containing protein [Pararhodospirillum oryzae]|uniref:Uncharacterized protein n=1 Tax=Pararhodospirillum oryzae TaxID=478448 RepID=A0A512HC15_9PROT|nr:hypothetical protein [Pararhodospirillum oryzae]GEO82984.1 hypothetical protein ROR02_31150 [Pararhodospirillum oryzae]